MINQNFLQNLLEIESSNNKELLYQLIDRISDYAFVVTDLDGTIVSWNPGAESLFGYSAKEAIGQSASFTFTNKDQQNSVPEREMLNSTGFGSSEEDRWHVRKDGSQFLGSDLQTALYNAQGEPAGFAKITSDLTARLNAEETNAELGRSNERLENEVAGHKQIYALSSLVLRRIVRTQEDERKRISRDIHDNIGQQMTALKLRLETVFDRIETDDKLAKDLASIRDLTRRIDSEIDFLAWELRPAVLDDFGLAEAAKRFSQQWSRHSNVPIEFECIGIGEKRVLPEIEINLYRILQEALNNISKYADPELVSVLLAQKDGYLSLVVEDDGDGFDVTPDLLAGVDAMGLGLVGMKERAEIVGGLFSIESEKGKGTSIFVKVPAVPVMVNEYN